MMFCRESILGLWISFVVLAGLSCFPAGGAQPDDFDTLEQWFHTLPMEARRLTGPLFWLHGDESPELLARYVQKVAEGGNGCFTAESRPHIDWLGPGWYRDLGVCLEAARKHDLKMWIFDERWWPSGEVGGKVPQQYACKVIEASASEVSGPDGIELDIPAERLIAVLAGPVKDNAVDGDRLIDLGAQVRGGKLRWQAPAGRWRVMVFTWRYNKGRRRNWLVDGASRDAVDWYIRTVYQPHYDHFADEFGKTIVGYFYDEPETPGDWGTEVIPMLKSRGVDWKKALVAWKFALADPDEQVAARYQYRDALAEAWGKTFYGTLTEWCHARGVLSIGHWLEHNHEYLHPQLCAGNMFQVQKYSDMGAIDAVFRQFVWGRKDDSTYQTPKLGSSISHAYGKKDDIAMVEIFGARGQDLTYPEMKWWTDHMQVSGINFMIPHSFNPRSPYDRDCPPYFYNNGYEPRWPLYRVYADYTSRLSLLLTGGRHVCPVALLYLGNSYHVGKAIPPENMTTALQDALFDCDWLPYEVFENDCRLAGREIQLREERYRVLIVPPVEVIPPATLEKAKAFFEAGGVVVGYGMLPSKSATLGRSSSEVVALCKAVWGEPEPGLSVCKTTPAGGRSYFLPEKPTPEQIQQVLAGDAGIHPALEVLEGETNHWLHVLHRVKHGRHIFFVCNQNHQDQPRDFVFRVHAPGEPECWDPMRNEISALRFRRVDEQTVDIPMVLHPLESVLLVFQPRKLARPARIEAQTSPVLPPIAIRRLPTPPELLTPEIPPVEGRPITRSPVRGDPFAGTC